MQHFDESSKCLSRGEYISNNQAERCFSASSNAAASPRLLALTASTSHPVYVLANGRKTLTTGQDCHRISNDSALPARHPAELPEVPLVAGPHGQALIGA